MQKELDDSEDITCPSKIEYYISCPIAIDGVCLAEFASIYTKRGQKRKQANKKYMIWSIRYNKYKDIENHCREKLMLYYPYRLSELTIKQHHAGWEFAYIAFESTVKKNE